MDVSISIFPELSYGCKLVTTGFGWRSFTAGIGWRIIACLFNVDGFGPITEPDQLGPALDKAIAIVESGKPVLVDVITQPR